MIKIIIFSLLSVSIFMAVGCEQKFKDISSREDYVDLIDSRFILLKSLKIHGISVDSNYGDKIGFYSVTKEPGIGGPEVVQQDDLEIGTQIEVKQVMKCSNCFFGSPIAIIIEVFPGDAYLNKQIRLYGLRVKNEDTGKIELDPLYLKKMAGMNRQDSKQGAIRSGM